MSRPGSKHLWIDTAIKLSSYGLGLAVLLLFWAQISQNLAGCYGSLASDGQPPPLEVGGSQDDEIIRDNSSAPPGSVRVKIVAPPEK